MKFIGIDPGINASGVWDEDTLLTEKAYSLPLWGLFDMLRLKRETKIEPFTIVVENSNLVKGNWHGKSARGNVGKNKGISQTIVAFLEAHNIPFVEIKPNGYSVMAKNINLFVLESQYQSSTNEHERAAFYICQAGKKQWVLSHKVRSNQVNKKAPGLEA